MFSTIVRINIYLSSFPTVLTMQIRSSRVSRNDGTQQARLVWCSQGYPCPSRSSPRWRYPICLRSRAVDHESMLDGLFDLSKPVDDRPEVVDIFSKAVNRVV